MNTTIVQDAVVDEDLPPARSEESPPGAAPVDGAVLEAGDHLVELELLRPCTPDVATQGLLRMGWSDVLIDQSVPSPASSSNAAVTLNGADAGSEWGVPGVSRGSDPRSEAAQARFRFVGRLMKPIRIRQHAEVQWLYAHRMAIDPAASLRLELVTYPLETGRIYEVRFLSRMRAAPTRAAVCGDLSDMGWDPIKLSALKKNMRLPRRPGASVTLWFGVARWEGPMSYIVAEDPFYFEDVVAI